MPQNNESMTTARRSLMVRLVAMVLITLIAPVTPSFAQAAGHVRVKIVKAGLLVGGGAGSGVLT